MNLEQENRGNPGNGSSDDFFDQLERQVNGAVQDDLGEDIQTTLNDEGPIEATPQNLSNPKSTQQVDWEKRYKDSSREATKLRGEINKFSSFEPLLNAMRKDPGLVDTVRDYLVNGGKPAQSVKENLGLSDDFIFDQEEAFNDPGSDSAKLLGAHIDKVSTQKVNNILEQERVKAQKTAKTRKYQQDISDFRQRRNLSDNEFKELVTIAKTRKLTLDDIYYLVNRDKSEANVAKATKDDILGQMKSVRNIPTSTGDVNSPRAEKSTDDQVFDSLNDSATDFDKLFG